MPRVTWILAIFLFATSIAAAREIYVDNLAGDDRNDGSSEKVNAAGSGPCRTIARALRAAHRGDRIILANNGEPYRESITLQGGRHSGSFRNPFQIEGNGAILDGSQPVPDEGWEFDRGEIFRFRPRRMSHQQLFLDDRPAQRQPVVSELLLPKLEPLEWCLFRRAIYFRVEKHSIPQSYQLSYAALPVGITLYEVRNVVISNLTVQGFQLDGINAHDSAFDVILGDVVCRGNGRSGVSVGGASRVKLDSCLVGNNGAAQLRTEGWSHTHVLNSDLLEKTAPAIVSDGGEVKVEDLRPPEE